MTFDDGLNVMMLSDMVDGRSILKTNFDLFLLLKRNIEWNEMNSVAFSIGIFLSFTSAKFIRQRISSYVDSDDHYKIMNKVRFVYSYILRIFADQTNVMAFIAEIPIFVSDLFWIWKMILKSIFYLYWILLRRRRWRDVTEYLRRFDLDISFHFVSIIIEFQFIENIDRIYSIWYLCVWMSTGDLFA